MRKKRVIINIITSLLLQFIIIICGFIIPRLIISTYGSSVNGLVTSITQFLAYITLLESGFGQVIKSVLFKPIAKQDKTEIAKILKASENIFRKIACIFVFYILILLVILPIVLKNEFSILFTISLIIIISISTFAEYYFGMVYKIYLQADQKVYIVSIIQIGTLILNTIAIVLLVHCKASIQIVKLVSAFIFVLRPILQNLYVKKKYHIYLKSIEGNYPIKQKWDGLAQHIAHVIHSSTDIVILTLFASLTEVSVYSIYILIINSIKNLISSFLDGVNAAFGDMIAKEEKGNLSKSFRLYEGLYTSIATIVFTTTALLIVPFVKIYTNGISDANYIRPTFAYIMIIAEFIYMIRMLYNILIKSAGHFKQTRNGAWGEAISNIVISIILVGKFGLVGVAIGTLVAITVRSIEIFFYASKYILNRSVLQIYKRVIVIAVEIFIIVMLQKIMPHIEINGYIEWIKQAVLVFLTCLVIVMIINGLIYRKNVKEIFQQLKVKKILRS